MPKSLNKFDQKPDSWQGATGRVAFLLTAVVLIGVFEVVADKMVQGIPKPYFVAAVVGVGALFLVRKLRER